MTRINTINLATITFFECKKLAKAISGKTNEEMAEEIGVGHEHVARHFREPNYNVSSAMLPALCRAMGNTLQIDWLCVHSGGQFVPFDNHKPADMSIDHQISRVCQEFADVVNVNAIAMMDGQRTDDEINRLDRELMDLIRTAEQARMANRAQRTAGKA